MVIFSDVRRHRSLSVGHLILFFKEAFPILISKAFPVGQFCFFFEQPSQTWARGTIRVSQVLTCTFRVHPERRGSLESGLEAACVRGCRAPFRAEVRDFFYFVVGWRIAIERYRLGFDRVDLGMGSNEQFVDIFVNRSSLENVGPGIDLVAINNCKRERQVAKETRRGCARVDDTIIDVNAAVSLMLQAHLHECREPQVRERNCASSNGMHKKRTNFYATVNPSQRFILRIDWARSSYLNAAIHLSTEIQIPVKRW
jgi:hypothetical protein